jgi:polyhydroxyalkanoate synthase
MEIGDRTVELSAITAPVLVFAGATDGIAPVAAVRPVLPLLSGSREVRFEIVPGGHLGMLTGRAARSSTWRVMDEWIGQWSTPDAPARKKPKSKKAASGKAASKAASTKASTKTRATKKPPAVRKTTTRKAPAKDVAPSSDAIGANPVRRYGSAGSRSLGT